MEAYQRSPFNIHIISTWQQEDINNYYMLCNNTATMLTNIMQCSWSMVRKLMNEWAQQTREAFNNLLMAELMRFYLMDHVSAGQHIIYHTVIRGISS